MSDSLKIAEMRAYLKALTKVDTKSAGGVISSAWSYAFHFYATVTEQKSNETFANLMPGARSSINFQTWYRPDLKRDMRIVFEDEEYDIVAVNVSFKTMNIDVVKVEQ